MEVGAVAGLFCGPGTHNGRLVEMEIVKKMQPQTVSASKGLNLKQRREEIPPLCPPSYLSISLQCFLLPESSWKSGRKEVLER